MTANSFHIKTANSGAVLDAIETAALVSTPMNGWVSVHFSNESSPQVQNHVDLSAKLQAPVLAFSCYDSDIAEASLASNGSEIGSLLSAHPDLVREVLGADPVLPVVVQATLFTLWADFNAWSSDLGPIDIASIQATIAEDPDCPFAEFGAYAALEEYGISPDRLSAMYHDNLKKDGYTHT